MLHSAHSKSMRPSASKAMLTILPCAPWLDPLAWGIGKSSHSLAVHLWRRCRSKFKAQGGAQILSFGLAEDARGKFELLKARVAYSDFTVDNIVLDL